MIRSTIGSMIGLGIDSRIGSVLRRAALAGLLVTGCIGQGTNVAASPVQIPGGGGYITVKRATMVDLKFKNVVRQRFDLSCGSAALATLLRYFYGLKVTEKQLIDEMVRHGDKTKISKLGFSMLELKKYGDRHGFVVRGFRVKSVESLLKLKIPVITLITTRGYGHFVVLKGAKDGRVYVADPAFGNRAKSFDEFRKEWSKVILVFVSRTHTARNRFRLTAGLSARPGEIRYLLDSYLTKIRPSVGEF